MIQLKTIFLFCLIIISCSCCRNYISLQEQWVDKEYLASSYVNTPDPEAKCFSCGKNLLIEWNFPISVYRKNLSIILTARLWDNTTSIHRHRVQSKQGSATMFFLHKDPRKRLLTYKVEVVSESDQLIESVENQFWTEKVDAL